MPSSHLINLIKDFNVTPNWEHIPLPQGIIQAPKKALQIDIKANTTFWSRSFSQRVQDSLSQYVSTGHPPSKTSSAVSTLRYDRSASARSHAQAAIVPIRQAITTRNPAQTTGQHRVL
jgi:hypothetical protein